MNDRDEERFDRRAHWAQIVFAAVVGVTAWCVKLEMTSTAVKSQIANIWQRFGQDHDDLTRVMKDVEWMKERKK